MKTLTRSTLRRFLELAGDSLTGEWVLMGGTVLPLLGVEHRSTVDIDLVGITDKERAQTLGLMEIAEELGLPVETINQAGGYFLHKIPGFRKYLKDLHRGKTARIYRPDVTLYLLLKISRMSETDLTDCLEALKLARAQKEKADQKLLLARIKKEIRGCTSVPKIGRLGILADALK